MFPKPILTASRLLSTAYFHPPAPAPALFSPQRWRMTYAGYSTKKREREVDMEEFEEDLFGESGPVVQVEDVYAEEVDAWKAPPGKERALPEKTLPIRPRLPGSIKKLNRILSRQRTVEIPEDELRERFVKGRGPGGQAINKTNSSVSLTHIPTGIRVQAQPTRSREENRKVARKILSERLELLRSTGQLSSKAGLQGIDNGTVDMEPSEGAEEMSKKERRKIEETRLGERYTKMEIKAEKERRRKANRAKKAKKKYGQKVDEDRL
ncbi:uncharacterized protein L203_103774 [Cryptococcus depauperatus CBS 7841]|uniref:Prokaryotic-type class I peptide chain release factors domain-containing protein n=1 Tax=Cryptococcus depauperatus CBS 7841 TaxID=1295531 RepID=A0A1E3IEA8_9TREE|nr:hypothetical protein L203_03727 [Cryptococcus depauperatus CBS 7841]